MSDKGKLALATFAFAVSALLQGWRPAAGGTAFLIGCVLAAWALGLKGGTAGEEQWNRIRSKGRLRFVLIFGLGFGTLMLAISFAPGLEPFNISRFARAAPIAFGAGCLSALWGWWREEKNFP
jgi:hypothetical protein